MKQFRILLYVYMLSTMPLALAQSCPVDNANPCGATPYFSIRSQGEDAAREMIGWQEFINLCGMDEFYGALSITTQYTQSFNSGDIARVLFGNDISSNECRGCDAQQCCSAITISGSQVGQPNQLPHALAADFLQAPRGANDWLADYFGLPTLWQSTICFTPKIKNVIVDLEAYFGLSQWADGLYARIHLPITWTKWDLQTRETIIHADVNDNDFTGYFADGGVARSSLLYSALNFFNGSQAPTGMVNTDGITINTFDRLKCSKWFSCCNQTALEKTGVADLELVLGYNAVCTDNGYFGLNIRTAAPTGNHPCGEFLFEPIVGNGGSWQLGGGIDTHAVMWRGEHDNTLSFYLDANITHLFKACQTRCFDLCGKPNSRYMLAERMTTNTSGLGGTVVQGDTTPADVTFADAQFAQEFSPVANLTMTKVKVSAAVQGDIALKFTYNNGNGFSWDVGYDFFGRSCEKICRIGRTPLTDGTTWALKGDAFVYGGIQDSRSTVPLSATESCATIHSGTNNITLNLNFIPQLNPNIDNPQFAVTSDGTTVLQLVGSSSDQILTSIQPIFLSEEDVDLAGTSIISNKFFAHMSYAWLDHEQWAPFLGGGFSVELAHNKSCCNKPCNTSCCTCHRTGASQWSIWLKGGAAWN